MVLFTGASVTSAPVVHMLVPGFTVEELPLRLSNINTLRFAPDGRLTALGYDGRIHLLRDSDGDGLEDVADLFWDEPTLRVPVGMVWAPEGLYVSSQGKVSLLKDADGDGRADEEEIIASGWPRTDVASGGVDATAITRDSEGNLYFGLLVANYANPYRLKDGVSLYDIRSPRGTIQKWSPATRRLETISTGIRVPYTLAFNRHGDLFVTDQEGETWLPGGNPLDEINHVLRGRHYGFPPRHSDYLPDVIDEPPVLAFGPQHQSTCGMVFNEASPTGKVFGPKWWEGDALVAGQSRGKIWRVRLIKTPFGYVGTQTLIARLSMLTTDVAISAGGALYVSCHSGKPDWGTGPRGEGKIFKITYTDPDAPQPVIAWAADPMETRIAFDRPISRSDLERLQKSEIEFGQYVSAADRFESLEPPYESVKEQKTAPRGRLRVVAARVLDDRRTLSLRTDPHPQAGTYAVSLTRDASAEPPAQTIDLAYELNGLEIAWRETADRPVAWQSWLPHLDSEITRSLLGPYEPSPSLESFGTRNGWFQIASRLQLPAGKHKLRIIGSSPFSMDLGLETYRAKPSPEDAFVIEADAESSGAPISFRIQTETGRTRQPTFQATIASAPDPTMRPMRLEQFQLPWSRPVPAAPVDAKLAAPKIAGGDWERGRSLFFGEKLNCAGCHAIRGEGKHVGPDLSNLISRDAAFVLHEIQNPDASIHPDYAAFNLTLHDGTELTGFVRARDETTVTLIGADGTEREIARENLQAMHPSAVSVMPTGLLQDLNESQIRDLLTFLLHAPPRRSAEEISAALKTSPPPSDAPKQLRIVLVASPQTYPPGQHDHPAWQHSWSALLERSPAVEVETAHLWPSDDQFRKANLLVFYFWNKNWNPHAFAQLDAFLKDGGGVAVFHTATIADEHPEELAARIGLAAQPKRTRYLHTPFVLRIADPEHPITRGFQQIPLLDEPYWPMIGDASKVRVLATTDMEEEARPMLWTFERGKGRVFASIPGHYTWTLDDPLFRVLALRGLAWAAGESTGRLIPTD